MSKPTKVGDVIPGQLLDKLGPDSRAAFEAGKSGERLKLYPHVVDDDIVARRRARLIPDRFSSARLENFAPESQSQKTALEIAKRFITRVRGQEPTMLALIGKQGTGKSHLLYATLYELLGDQLDAFSRPWYRLADELRYGIPAQLFAPLAGSTAPQYSEPVEAHAVRSQLWRPKLVMIDEVRPTASTALDENELAKFACHAYDNAVSVFITTNVSPLDQVMGAPAASRFTQITIDGPDHRQSK